jgi:two-component system KDP operon response regulator KdpE
MADPHPVALLVEDDKQIRRLVQRVLEDQGWIVHEADTVARGLRP